MEEKIGNISSFNERHVELSQKNIRRSKSLPAVEESKKLTEKMHLALAMKNCLKNNSPLFCVKTINKLLDGFGYSQDPCLSCSPHPLSLSVAKQLNDRLFVLTWTNELFKENSKSFGEMTVDKMFDTIVIVEELFSDLSELLPAAKSEEWTERLTEVIWTIESFKDYPQVFDKITVDNLVCHSTLFQQMFSDLSKYFPPVKLEKSNELSILIWTIEFLRDNPQLFLSCLKNLLPHGSSVDYIIIDLGLSLILFSLFTKLACAPFHLWSLDVYEGSPTSSSFFFAVMTKLSVFVLLIRLCYITFHHAYESWQFYFFWVGVFSVFVGAFGGLKQRKIKTLLAYSSTTNMGYALLALGLCTKLGIEMLFFHLVIYIISGLCTWSMLLFLRLKTKRFKNKYNKELGDLVLLQKSNPALAFALSLTMFSIAGIPPMIGFLAKMGVFLSLLQGEFYVFVIASAMFSVVATFYYIRIIKVLYFENLLVGKLYYSIKTTKTITLSILIFLLLLLFVSPSIVYFLTSYVAKDMDYNLF
jgi:Proton-conducting membrane transporter